MKIDESTVGWNLGRAEGPPGSAAGLFRGNGVDVLDGQLVDVPRRRSSAGSAVLVGEAAIGDRWGPSPLGEQCSQPLQPRVVGDSGRPTLYGHVEAVNGDTESTTRVSLDVANLARLRTATEVVMPIEPEGADTGHVGSAIGIDRGQPEGVVVRSASAGLLGQVGLELQVFEANEIGRGFYDAYGFQPFDRHTNEQAGQSELRLRFEPNT